MLNVAYIYRCPQPEFHSIEELFGTVARNLPPGYSVSTFSAPAPGASPRAILKNCSAVRGIEADVKHITGHVNYLGIALGGNTVLTVHDVGSALYRKAFGNLLIKLLWFWLPGMRVRCITVVSEFSRRELASMIPFAKRKIRVVGNPYPEGLAFSPGEFRPDRPRILHIGVKPNKNLQRTVDAIRGMPCTLVVIGCLSAGDRKYLDASGVVYENYFNLSFEQLTEQYRRCDLLCFASTYEGFGMPVLEANVIGRPVVAGRAGAVPEVAGNAACLVDPYDPRAIRAGIRRILNNPGYRDQLIDNGLVNAARFEPRQVASQYAGIYAEFAVAGQAGAESLKQT